MSAVEGWFARLGSVLRGPAADARIEQEFQFHIEQQTEKNMALGMSPAEARRSALLAFGGLDTHREHMREERGTRLLAELRQDVRFVTRSLAHSRGFAVTAIFIIALGVGATTTLFSLANALLFRPLPVASSEELYVVQEVRRGSSSRGTEGFRIPYARFEAYREGTRDVFTGLTAHAFRRFSLRSVEGGVSVQGMITSPEYFEVLGLRPALGRFYTSDAGATAVLSHEFWQEQFDGRSDALGEAVYLDGRPHTVIGVAPRPFSGTTVALRVAVWVPFAGMQLAEPGAVDNWVGMIGRVRDRESIAGAEAKLTTLALRIPAEDAQTTIERAYLEPLTGLPSSFRGAVAAFMGMLVAAAVLVLLIAAANIAALLLARAVARRREISLRLALGAGRPRLIRQLLTESVVLFLAGGTAGIALAFVAAAVLSRVSMPSVPLTINATPDLSVLLFALTLAGVTGVLFGLAPALAAVRADLSSALKEGGPQGGSTRTRGRSVFVAAQLSLAMVLLITAGLFVRGLQRGLSADAGFDAQGVVVGTVDLGRHGYTKEQGRALQAELLRRVRALPQVESAAFARGVLLTGNVNSTDMRTAGDEPVSVNSAQNVVDDGYMRTMRIDLLAGRAFTAADVEGSAPVAIVNETLGKQLWPGRSPLGQTLLRGGSMPHEVVGVTRDGRYVDLGEAPRPFAFFAAGQHYSADMTLHVRGRAESGRLVRAVRDELRALDPDIALEFAMPLTRLMGLPIMPHRFAAALIGAFGVLGLILAAAGVYGVMAYQVAQRTREFGIRIALGARSTHVMRLVVGHGAGIAAGGAVVGLLLAAAVTRLLSGLLFGLSPLDPVTFAVVGATLAAVSIVASWLPARRALRVDPTVSLRSD